MATRTPRVVRVYRLGAFVARGIPTRALPFLSRLAGFVLAMRRNDARTMIERNLVRVYGHDRGTRAMRRSVRATYASYVRYYAESFKLPAMTLDEVARGFRVDGYEHIDAAIAAHQGPILALPHLGGWEWAGFWLALVPQVKVSAVAEQLDPPELFAWFRDLRTSLGMEIIALGSDAGSSVTRAIRSNHVTCLLCDRHVGGSSVEVVFFGERTRLPAGPVTLALRTGAPVLPTAVYFDGVGHHGVVRPPLPLDRRGSLRDDVTRITQLLADELELLIRAAPEQWHLLQPNWPSDFAALGRPLPPPVT